MDAEVAHARDRTLGDHKVVESLKFFVQIAIALNFGVQHGTRVDGATILMPSLQGAVQVRQPDLSKKAQSAEIDAEDGNACFGEGPRSGE